MRVTDAAAGGGAAPRAEVSAPASYPRSEEDAAAALPSSGLAAAVLRGPIGSFYQTLERLPSVVSHELPPLSQIVLVGQEGSGKSSVLESLAMLPLFPRDSDLHPSVPIVLQFRHMSHTDVEDAELMPHCGSNPQLKMKLVFSDGRAPVESGRHCSAQEAATLMSHWTQQLAQEQEGVTDHVLEIQVRSPHVPDLDLVDLPGLVAATRPHEPHDMMQRTRAVAEKFLQLPNTFVLAVVPAFERVRNSQALQLVQQRQLADRTLGVLTMVDRALDETHPDGPLADVQSRLDGSSGDVVSLKHGYVAVKNRDARSSFETSLEECKEEEETWLEENLPGAIDRGLASSTVLATKLAEMLADDARVTWVPDVLAKVKAKQDKYEKKLADLGPDAQSVLNYVLGVSPASARERMLELTKPIIPELLSQIDEEMLRLAALVHADFLQSREDHELILAPFCAKQQQFPFGKTTGSLVAASMLVLDSRDAYVAEHVVQIVKNVVVRIVHLVQKTIAASAAAESKGPSSPRLDRFTNLHLFFAGALWERLNELLMEEDGLVQCLEKSFVAFDPEKAAILQLPSHITPTSRKAADQLKSLARELETYLEANGFQNTSLDEVFLPPEASTETPSLTREMSRLIVSAQVPTLATSKPPAPKQSSLFGGFASAGSSAAFAQPAPTEVGEFESRLFFALTSHVVAPLLQSICDVSDLARKMQEYASRYPKVNASQTHIFHDKTADKRKQLAKLVKRLDESAAQLKSIAASQ